MGSKKHRSSIELLVMAIKYFTVHGEATAPELQDHTSVTVNTVYDYLRALKEAGLIYAKRREGQKVVYGWNPSPGQHQDQLESKLKPFIKEGRPQDEDLSDEPDLPDSEEAAPRPWIHDISRM